jgi:hypothetical protein
MNYFDQVVEKASTLPSSDNRFIALESYVDNLDEFINITCSQTEVRLKAKIIVETDPVVQAEMEGDAFYMRELGKTEFSMTICGSVLVSTYFAYEASIINLLDYLAKMKGFVLFANYKKKHSKRIKLAHDGNINFLILVEEYVNEFLKIDVFGGGSYLVLLEDLRVLRNSYVHNGCLLYGLPDKTKEKIINGTYRGVLQYRDVHWFVTPEGSSTFFKKTYESFKYFKRHVFEAAIA